MRVAAGLFCAAIVAVIIWVVQWSPIARDCHARGGTNVDPLTFACFKTTRM